MEIKGKIAVVTGASKGIGLATVHALLEAGAKVAGWSRSNPGIEDERFFFCETDVADFKQVENAYSKTKSHYGQAPAILINNAGLGYEGFMDEMPMEQWMEMFNINVHGLYFCSKVAIPDMKELGEAHIVNIASIAGTTGIPGMSGYCGTKHAVRGISHSMYKELRNFGIKVTCIYPGSVQTHFFDSIDSVTANENMMQPQDVASSIMHCLASSGNYHHVDIEVRPLKPKG